jgi:hypothetical protein
MRKFSLIILMAASLMACEEGNDTAYNRGYSDGYAVGYNTACKIRATLDCRRLEQCALFARLR